ncbi:hypothetical protein ACHAXN_008987 [Cyclotella atomus]
MLGELVNVSDQDLPDFPNVGIGVGLLDLPTLFFEVGLMVGDNDGLVVGLTVFPATGGREVGLWRLGRRLAGARCTWRGGSWAGRGCAHGTGKADGDLEGDWPGLDELGEVVVGLAVVGPTVLGKADRDLEGDLLGLAVLGEVVVGLSVLGKAEGESVGVVDGDLDGGRLGLPVRL